MADNNVPPDPSNYDPRNQEVFNKFAKENAKIAAEITNEARSLTEELKDQLGIRSRLNETEKSTLNLARQLQSSASQNTVEIGNSGNIQRQINKDRRIALNIEREINDLKSTSSEDEINFAKKISDTTDKINDLQKEIAEATGKKAEELKDQLGAQEEILKFSLEDSKSSTQRLALAMSMSKTTAKLIAQRGVESDIQDRITDKMGVTGALVKGTGALMERLGMRSGIFQKAMTDSAETMRDMAEQTERGEASFSKTEIMVKGLSKLSQGFGKALFDPFTIATAILDAFFKINKQSVEISRLTGQLGSNFDTSFGSAASMVDQMEVVAELTKQTGINAQNAFSQENIAGAANLKVEMGLAANEAGNLAMMAQTSGTNVDALTDSIVSTTSEFNNANRSAVSQGVVLRDIGNVSEGIRASFHGNTEALVKGAAAARRLGMDMKELDNIANSLLDFESSIEAELEAQLLTGKNINMSKARELALSNDLAGLGKELFDNSSSLADFGKMNRIQQEAQAKALGMTRDQLAKVAYQRGIELNMTEEQAAAAAGVEASDMRRLTAQENFSKAIEKIAASLAPILDFVGNILSIPWVPQILLGALAVGKLGSTFGGIFKSATSGFSAIKSGVKEAGGLMGSVFGKFYKGGQFMPGGGRAAAGGERAGGLVSTLKDKAKNLFKSKEETELPDSLTKTGDTVGDLSDKTKGAKPEAGAGIKGFLKGLGDGLASIGRQIGDVIKGSIAIGIAGLALGGSFALALRMVKDVDPVQMIAFAGAISMFGLTLALLGKIGSSVIKGALALGILGVGLIPAAYAFSLLAGVDAGSMFAFAGALSLLGLAAAGLGFLFPYIAMGAGALALLGLALIPAAYGFSLIQGLDMDTILGFAAGVGVLAATTAAFGLVAPLIMLGSLALAALGAALIPAAYGFSLIQGLDMDTILGFAKGVGVLAATTAALGLIAPLIMYGSLALAALGLALIPLSYGFAALGDTPIESIISKIQGLATLAPQLLLVGAGLMGIAAGLGMIAISGIAAIPALAALSAFALVASPLAALGGLFGDGEGEDDNSMAEISSKLDTLISVVSAGGNVYLDGDKVGEAQVLGTYKLS